MQEDQPGILAALEALVDPVTRGNPTSPLRWTCKSRAKLAAALTEQGSRVSSTTVGRLRGFYRHDRLTEDGRGFHTR
ncbi:MAG: hypothetical protein F4X12_18825 [Acidobacteriia bacterium]|nr:hypothetical protein [Terriglobia bacterium]